MMGRLSNSRSDYRYAKRGTGRFSPSEVRVCDEDGGRRFATDHVARLPRHSKAKRCADH